MLTTLILKANRMYLDRNAHYKIVFTIPPVTSLIQFTAHQEVVYIPNEAIH